MLQGSLTPHILWPWVSFGLQQITGQDWLLPDGCIHQGCVIPNSCSVHISTALDKSLSSVHITMLDRHVQWSGSSLVHYVGVAPLCKQLTHTICVVITYQLEQGSHISLL